MSAPENIIKFAHNVKEYFDLKTTQVWINWGNMLISIVYLFVFLVSKKVSEEYRMKWNEKEYDLCDLAELDRDKGAKTVPSASREKLKGYEKRVTALIGQYLWSIRIFVVSLVFVYLSILLAPINDIDPKEQFRPLTRYVISLNIFNFLGGIIIVLSFWILYRKTLNNRDQDNQFWLIPAVIAGFYIFLFMSLSWQYELNGNAYYFLNIFDLTAGLVNGLAMFLLYGRYISLEQSLRDTYLFKNAFTDIFKSFPLFKSERSYTKLVSITIIFLLPIYALVQPQFGSFGINLYGSPMAFQTVIYGICLLGKLCFLHLTYLLISKKLLHLYLFGLISKIGNFSKLEECFNEDNRD